MEKKTKPKAQQEVKETKEDDTFSLKDLKFTFDLSQAHYELDILQNKLLEFYLRADNKFRRAFSMNYTNEFLQFLRDKARLKEPTHLSIIGQVRTITDNNFIYTDKGWRKPSDMKDCKLVLSWNFDLEKYEWKKYELVKKKRDLKEDFYKVTFSDNRIIELGENHPIFTERKGWKRAFSLYPEIKIPYFSEYPQQKYENEISIEKARVIACLLSCGHLNNSSFNSLDKRDGKFYNKTSYTISYCSSSQEMIDFFCNNFEKEFKIKPRLKNKRENYNGIEVEIPNKQIFEELNKFVPSGKKSHIIEIPKEIFNASKEIQKEFVATLFSGDGYVSDCKDKKQTAVVEYYTMSNKFAQQLQLILLQYGIILSIHKKKTHINSLINRITITNKQNILKFDDFVKILPHPKKNERLKQIVKKLDNLQKYLKPRKFYIKSNEKFECKEDYIYDIFVEDNHNFFLNGILTKNSGKSYIALSIATFQMACAGKKFTADYICANPYEFVEKLKVMPQEKLDNTTFVIDESKQAVYGVGSIAKKMKITDVQNIIAIRGISTISLTPNSWSNKDAFYGLRLFGRCFKTKTCRAMLYNLQAGGRGGETPMGCVYLPIFTTFLPKDYADELEKAYLEKKNAWVMQEQRGEGDVLGEIKKKSAESFMRDRQFLSLTKKNEQLTYISQKLGSEWTKTEVDEIYQISKLLKQGIDFGSE